VRTARLAGLLAVLTTGVLPGCVTGAEVVVVVGHDAAGVPVAGAVACLPRKDLALDVLTVGSAGGREVQPLEPPDGGEPRIARVDLGPVPEPVPERIVVTAIRHDEIPEDAVRATLDRAGTPDTYLVATADGRTEGLGSAGAAARVEGICEDVGEWRLGPLEGFAGFVALGVAVLALTGGGVVVAGMLRRRSG
jgi:hypothetical protein